LNVHKDYVNIYPDVSEIHRNKFEHFRRNLLSGQEVFLKPRQRPCYCCVHNYENLKDDVEEVEAE